MVNAITSGDILSAEQLKRHSKVYAGPGAGKTYFLVENVKNIITTNESVAKSKARNKSEITGAPITAPPTISFVKSETIRLKYSGCL